MTVSILLVFASLLLFFTEASYTAIDALSIWVRTYFGRFYLYLGLGCVLFCAAIAISPWGRIRLGKEADRPAFSRLAWISMLYSAGMGAGILLRAVQEPVYMQQHPPLNIGTTAETMALEYTFYQWGFTAWAFYAIFALMIGHAVFKRGQPVAISAIVDMDKEPLSRLRVFRNGIEVLTLLTTVFGLVAAVGLGASQINGGLNHLLDTQFGHVSIILLVIVIGLLALLSALSGVSKGIKQLSQFNIYLTFALLLLVLAQSDILSVFKAFGLATWHYLIDFIPMSLAIGDYDPGEAFLVDWTYYYWAFWLAWAPFTGIFIARISQGRTFREIIIGTLLIPSLGTFFWFSTFGQSAFGLLQDWGSYEGQFDNVFTSIFVFLENYPASTFINAVVILLLVSFLVTSVDSAIYVLSMLSDRGNPEPARNQKLLWGFLLILCCVGLVLLGHAHPDTDVLTAVQKLLIVTSLPFALLMVVLVPLWMRTVKTGRAVLP